MCRLACNHCNHNMHVFTKYALLMLWSRGMNPNIISVGLGLGAQKEFSVLANWAAVLH